MRVSGKQILAALLLAGTVAAPLWAMAEVVSLRGDAELQDPSVESVRYKQEVKEGGFKRAWELQPPVIPHDIEKERISLKENTCLGCHSPENFEKEKAPKIGDSHFVDATGAKLDVINERRHFCTQCHVPQMDAKPLVENTFGQ